ncbi:GNAT family N-acetyltransferase [Halobium salinum]|uniref:GNAT family N-acetyltransferase n=1 Tax=Halobium salinum TaxID=1364940 RepID=A0ABD5P687_9EURY|nr:GNAT family N-acetyltransferase [Halobium salinum]
MYVRDAKNRDEVWLLDHIEAMGLDDVAFRSRDYVIAVDETNDEKAGFGRLRIHKAGDGEEADDCCELTGIGTLSAWRGQGVGAHVVERLVDKAAADGFAVVYSLTPAPNFLAQFGFEPVTGDELPERIRDRLSEKRDGAPDDGSEVVGMRLPVDEFEMPERLREAFKTATPQAEGANEPEESAEDFGIDPEQATYKYDTGR